MINLRLIDALPTLELRLALVAHEIFHCLHGERISVAKQEELANELCRSWGFDTDALFEWECANAEIATSARREQRAMIKALRKGSAKGG